MSHDRLATAGSCCGFVYFICLGCLVTSHILRGLRSIGLAFSYTLRLLVYCQC